MAAHGQLTVAAIVVAAGSGSRLGAELPKAFVTVAGRTVLEHAALRLFAHARIGARVVVVPPGWVERAAGLCDATVAVGGDTRQQSVDAGLRAVSTTDLVLVHDAARAFAPADVTDRVLAALDDGADAAIPGLPVTDTVKRVDGSGTVLGTVDRRQLVAVQTPQGFRRQVLAEAHAAAATPDATDDAALVEALGYRVVAVRGDERAVKLTVPLDLALAEVLARD